MAGPKMAGPKMGRRTLLGSSAAAIAGVAIAPSTSLLATDRSRRFVSLYFSSGWDVLLGLDPRDPARRYSAIDVGTDLLAPEFRDPVAVTIGGRETLWGAPMAAMVRHADVTTVFRGVDMNTVAHPTGRAYINSFIPPAGVLVRGDSIGTRMAAESAGSHIMPNVSIGFPTFNPSYGPDVTGIRMERVTEIRDLLTPLGRGLGDDVEALLREAQDASTSCVGDGYRGRSPAEDLRASRRRVRSLLSADLGQRFDFSANEAIQTRYGITNPSNANDPRVIAATVFQLLDTELCRAVTAKIQPASLDTHSGWAGLQPVRLKAGFDALALLLDDLRDDDPELERTTVLIHSEFARTPKINGNQGRDHWFANSFAVFGGGLRRGVFGATADESLGLLEIDRATGEPRPGSGFIPRPEHIGATLAAASGVDWAPFRVSPLTDWIA